MLWIAWYVCVRRKETETIEQFDQTILSSLVKPSFHALFLSLIECFFRFLRLKICGCEALNICIFESDTLLEIRRINHAIGFVRPAFTGTNGAGKTTVFRMITG